MPIATRRIISSSGPINGSSKRIIVACFTTVDDNNDNNENTNKVSDLVSSNNNQYMTSRRKLLEYSIGIGSLLSIPQLSGAQEFSSTTTTTTSTIIALDDDMTTDVVSSEQIMNQTPSGLKYIDLQIGNGISPLYGNLCCIQYTAYVKLAKTLKDPNPKPIQFDKVLDDGYLIKHGNGRMISGLDEGLHTMKVGGIRRIIIPPKLGFIEIGLGPIPIYPWQRSKLNSLLDEMINVGSGTLIYEVKLLSIMNDEADQGYYNDESLSPEDFNTLRENLRIKGLQQRNQNQQQSQLQQKS